MANTFNKQERLCSSKQMELLFSKGKGTLVYPVKTVCLQTPVSLKFPAQAMFVVPKRQFKRANVRNTLKRRMREAYRLNKEALYNELNTAGKKMIIAFIYVGKKEEEYKAIETAILKQLKQLPGN